MIKEFIKESFLYKPLLWIWNTGVVRWFVCLVFYRNYAFEKCATDYENLQKRCEPREHVEDRVEQTQFLCRVALEVKRQIGASWATEHVLDIGAREGWSLDFLNQLGFKNLTGVEVVSDYVEYAQSKGRNVVKAQGESLVQADSSFSVVISRHTLEHAENPLHFVSESVRVLRPGGVYIVSFPMQLEPSGKHCTAIPSAAAFSKLLCDAKCLDVLEEIYSGPSIRKGVSGDGSDFLFIARKKM